MRLKLAIIITTMVLGLVFLVFSTSSDEAHPHYLLPDFKKALTENGSRFDNVFMTLYGDVKEGSIEREGIKANFVIEKDGVEMPVIFTGKSLLPDTFKDGAQASVDGIYNRHKQIFVADKVMAKCASKYDSAADYKKKYN